VSLPSLSIRRPVLTWVLSAFILLLGLIGMRQLGVREYPAIDPPLISVSATYPGASAEVVEHQVVEPLEQSLNGIDGIRSITSQSRDGSARVSVEFLLGVDLERAANDVRDRVSRARSDLPASIDPPVVAKADANGDPIVLLTVQSPSRSLLSLSEQARVIADRLQTIPGVAEVDIWGERKYAMRIRVDPTRMSALGISLSDVRAALRSENADLPAGSLEGTVSSVAVQSMAGLSMVDDFRRMVVRSRDGATIRLGDVADVALGAENERSLLRSGGQPMAGLSVLPQPGADQIAISDEIQRRVAQMGPALPPDIRIGTAFDNTRFVRKALLEVRETIAIAFLLVVLVIFAFLRDWRTTLIPMLAVPISLVGVFFPVWVLGYSINVLTLLGIVLAIGLVVDDAIVVLENVYAKIEQGMAPRQAAVAGVEEIFAAVVSTTLVLASVFTPLLFLSGFTGRLFREFGVVIGGSALISGFVALTLAGMLSSRLLRPHGQENRLHHATEPIFRGLHDGYGRILSVALRHPWVAIPVILAALAGTAAAFNAVPKELSPLEDRGAIMVRVTGPEGATFPYTDEYMQRLARAVENAVPEISTMLVMSGSYGGTTNMGMLRILLKPVDQRHRSPQEIANALKGLVAKVDGASALVIQDPSIRSGGRSNLAIQFVLQAPDIDELRRTLGKFTGRVRQDSTFSSVDVDLKFTKPQLDLSVDRDRLRDLGTTPYQVAQTLQSGYAENRWGYFLREGKQYQIIGSVDSAHRETPDGLQALELRTPAGTLLPVGTLVRMKERPVPPQLYRYDRYVSATVSADPAPGRTIAQGIGTLRRLAQDSLPANFHTTLSGSSRDFVESSGSVLRIFLLSLLIVYLLLAAQFESFRDPFVILLTVPLALAGAMGSLLAFGCTLNLFSEIGLVMLVGLVTKNGILIVEFSGQRRRAGLAPAEAALEAAVARLRPILMTTLCMSLGTLPIALALGAGSESRKPMGIAIIGGLLVSLCFTLFVIPCMYALVEGLAEARAEKQLTRRTP
jgi:multidrug efflux pump